MAQWLWLTWAAAAPAVMLAGAAADITDISDEQYFSMPAMYHMDHYEQCMSSPGGVFCLGDFQLRAKDQNPLMDIMQTYSSNKKHFNRTLVHRGYCISARCGHTDGSPSAPERFARCVDRHTRQAHGLTARLLNVQYCKTGHHQRPVDALDSGFAYCVGLIVLANLLATAHDLLRGHDTKPNPYIQAWSLVANWRRLTIDQYAEGSTGDPALKMFIPISGLRVLSMALMLLGHVLFVQYSGYAHNPEYSEAAHHNFSTVLFLNGTTIVQTFFLMSSFLLAYTMLRTDSGQGHQLSFRSLPYYLLHRVIRLLPVYMFVVGLSATWWSRVGEGPLWGPLVGSLEARCRTSWWTHALFINNFITTENTCLLHTWYVAADMQLYVVACALTGALARWGRRSALRVLAALLLVSVLANFLAAYYWELKTVAAISFPEVVRVQYAGDPSFNWMYKMPWSSLPTTLIGIACAFIFHHVQQLGYNFQDNKLIRVLYQLSFPLLLVCVFSGFWTRELTSPHATALIATLERPVFALLMAVKIFGVITNIGYVWNRYLSWHCWQVLGRLSLSVYLVHWTFLITQIALRHHVTHLSGFLIMGNWLVTLVLSYAAAVPIYLMIESPIQKFMNALFFKRST